MPSLDNPHNSNVNFVDVPGRPDQVAGIWRLTMLSTSDTVTAPELLTSSTTNNQSSARVMSPATGVTAVTTANPTSDNQNVITVASSSAGSEVVLMTLHLRGRVSNSVPPNPA
jgi:hypothetical protein